MEAFLKSNISKINKSYLLHIQFGKKIDKSIFDNRLNETTVKNLMKNLQNQKHSFKTYNQTIYYYDNIYLKYNNSNGSSSIHSFKQEISKSFPHDKKLDLNFSILNILDTPCPESVYNYNNIERKEIIVYDLSLFNLELSKLNDHYAIKIIIKKPNKYEDILSLIHKIINYLN